MTGNAYQLAIATLRACTSALAVEASPAARRGLLELQVEALRTVELSSERRKLSTQALAVRIAELERKLARMAPAERAKAIRSRLGLSRATYYRLRKLAESQTDETAA